MGLCPHSVGCLAWGDQTLDPNSCFLGLMSPSRKAHINRHLPELLLPVSLNPSEPSFPHSPEWGLSILAHRSGTVSYGLTTFFPMDPGAHETLCAPSTSGVFISLNTVEFPLAYRSSFSGDSSSCCQTPRLRSLIWSSEASLLYDNLCGIIVFQFVSCLPSK